MNELTLRTAFPVPWDLHNALSSCDVVNKACIPTHILKDSHYFKLAVSPLI